MTHIVECPICGTAVSTERTAIGRTVVCPHCETRFPVPSKDFAPHLIDLTKTTTEAGAGAIRFHFQCVRCGVLLEGISQLCGKQGRCPTCGVVFIVPGVNLRTGAVTDPPAILRDDQLPTPLHAYAASGELAPKLIRIEDGEHVIECPRCRRRSQVDANVCNACGAPFTLEGAASTADFKPSHSNLLARAALGVGLASIPTFQFPILGVIAIGMGWAAMIRFKHRVSRRERNAAIAGTICGSIVILLAILRHFL